MLPWPRPPSSVDVAPLVTFTARTRKEGLDSVTSSPPTPSQARPSGPSSEEAPPLAPSVAAAALRPPAAPAAPHVTEADCEAVLSEVRMAIRGKLPADIARGTGLPPEVVSEACDLLVARGHALRRGLKVFVA